MLADNVRETRVAVPRQAIMRALTCIRGYASAAEVQVRILNEDSFPAVSGSLGWDNIDTPMHWQLFDEAGRFARLGSSRNVLDRMAADMAVGQTGVPPSPHEPHL